MLVLGLNATELAKLSKGDIVSMLRTCARGCTKVGGEGVGDGHAALANTRQANQTQTAVLLSITTYDGEAKADSEPRWQKATCEARRH